MFAIIDSSPQLLFSNFLDCWETDVRTYHGSSFIYCLQCNTYTTKTSNSSWSSWTFHNFRDCSEMFYNDPRCFEVFPNVLDYSWTFQNITGWSGMLWNTFECSAPFLKVFSKFTFISSKARPLGKDRNLHIGRLGDRRLTHQIIIHLLL